jgi:hypothetical protein
MPINHSLLNGLLKNTVGRPQGNGLRRLDFLLIILGMTLVSAGLARANVEASIPAPATLDQATDIKAQPLAMLYKFPAAGPALAKFVAENIVRDPSAIDAILSVGKDASPQQASAIGAGLVRGVRVIAVRQPKLANAIAAKVAGSDNLWMKTTFVALGANYSTAGASLIASQLPLLSGGGGSVDGIGSVLSPEKARVRKYDEFAANPVRGTLNNSSISDAERMEKERGTIIAILASDAILNGATSTSPTQ